MIQTRSLNSRFKDQTQAFEASANLLTSEAHYTDRELLVSRIKTVLWHPPSVLHWDCACIGQSELLRIAEAKCHQPKINCIYINLQHILNSEQLDTRMQQTHEKPTGNCKSAIPCNQMRAVAHHELAANLLMLELIVV